MTNESELREKLRKIEALFAGATTAGEKAAAGAAADRIRDAKPGSLRLMPNADLSVALRRDYAGMREMIIDRGCAGFR